MWNKLVKLFQSCKQLCKKPVRFLSISNLTLANHFWQLNVTLYFNYFPFTRAFPSASRLGHKSTGKNFFPQTLQYGARSRLVYMMRFWKRKMNSLEAWKTIQEVKETRIHNLAIVVHLHWALPPSEGFTPSFSNVIVERHYVYLKCLFFVVRPISVSFMFSFFFIFLAICIIKR